MVLKASQPQRLWTFGLSSISNIKFAMKKTPSVEYGHPTGTHLGGGWKHTNNLILITLFYYLNTTNDGEQ